MSLLIFLPVCIFTGILLSTLIHAFLRSRKHRTPTDDVDRIAEEIFTNRRNVRTEDIQTFSGPCCNPPPTYSMHPTTTFVISNSSASATSSSSTTNKIPADLRKFYVNSYYLAMPPPSYEEVMASKKNNSVILTEKVNEQDKSKEHREVMNTTTI